MRASVIPPGSASYAALAGSVLAHDVEVTTGDGKVRLRKGRVLRAEDAPVLAAAQRTLHVLSLDDGDVHEDAAARRLAQVVAGTGLVIGDPHESMMTLRAAHRGLLSVDADRLLAVNCVPDMSVWTLYDAQLVKEQQAVAGVKVTPLVTREEMLREAEQAASGDPAVIRVLPFVHRRAGVLVREELIPAAGERFREAITAKVEWFGSAISAIVHAGNDVQSVADALRHLIAGGADMVLCAGVTSTDPLDVTVQALDALGVRWEKRGVPAHPGSTYWLAYLGDVPILGMASCGMFSRATVLDLILPRFFAGQRVDARILAALGHGGLLNKGMAYRFPEYASPQIAADPE
ncbi:MAG: molybdopterin-binding protein [Thermomicrobiales bacterium]